MLLLSNNIIEHTFSQNALYRLPDAGEVSKLSLKMHRIDPVCESFFPSTLTKSSTGMGILAMGCETMGLAVLQNNMVELTNSGAVFSFSVLWLSLQSNLPPRIDDLTYM